MENWAKKIFFCEITQLKREKSHNFENSPFLYYKLNKINNDNPINNNSMIISDS